MLYRSYPLLHGSEETVAVIGDLNYKKSIPFSLKCLHLRASWQLADARDIYIYIYTIAVAQPSPFA